MSDLLSVCDSCPTITYQKPEDYFAIGIARSLKTGIVGNPPAYKNKATKSGPWMCVLGRGKTRPGVVPRRFELLEVGPTGPGTIATFNAQLGVRV